MIRVLLVDDDVSITELLELRLTGRGLAVVSCNAADDALRVVASQEFDCVVTDLNMAGMNGLELCERLVENRPGLPVIVMTAHTALDNAVAALRAGATDFLTKPIDLNALEFAIERATTQRRLTTELRRLQTSGPAMPRFEELIGESPAMKKLFDLLSRVAEIDASVLIVGESGTGKERVAHALHRRSRRSVKPFVAINCAAVPEHLLESELFGHVRGAFTDAKTDHVGLFQQAHGGTLFLDEVGELPLRLQPKLLRALQERTVRAVGGTREVPCDIRLVAATNRDLDRLVYEGHFREDLYYRINVVQIKVPPLRNREGDVALFAQHFLDRYAHQSKKAVRGFAPAALAKLSAYNWPGNVRELQNSIESAVAMTNFDQLTVDDLPERIQSYRAPAVVLSPTESVDLLPLEEVERRHMQRVLAACGGNKTLAAKILKVNRRTLGRKFGVDSQTEGDDSGSSSD